MALPNLDATFASFADLPRRQMLAKWLVEELGETQAPSNVLVSEAGSGVVNGTYTYTGVSDGKPHYNLPVSSDTDRSAISWLTNQWTIWGDGNESQYSSTDDVEFPWQVTTWIGEDGGPPMPTVTEIPSQNPIANYYDLPERYLWAKIAVAAGAPREEAAYISLPKNYAWSDIYNAVAGSSGNHTDWSENVALGHIAAAYRGDTGNPANLATYIDWPWRYKVASIITSISGESDPYFSNVSLLLHMDGTNESQSFVDSSSNNFSLTVSGNVNIDTSKSKFGSGSALFDGTDDFIECPVDSVFDFEGGDLTIEMWFYTSNSDWQTMISRWSEAEINGRDFFLGLGQSEGIQFYVNSSLEMIYEDGYPLNEWNHLAVTRSGSTFKMFLNGQQVDSAVINDPIQNSGGSIRIGDDDGGNTSANGWIDEVRITKGIARYTSNFTPSNSAFPNQ